MPQVTPWRGTIDCEGGPVLVANASDFARWTGSDPLPISERRELHLWGNFTSELPERFRPAGPTGHQYIPAPDPALLEAMCDELLAHVREQWPGTSVRYEFETWFVRRPDGRQMQVQLEPTSEYDRCIRDLREARLHRFDGGRACLVWSAEPGSVDVVRDSIGRIVLVQVRFAEDEGQAEAAVLQAVDESMYEGTPMGLSLDIRPGPVVVAWAPNSESDWEARLRTSEPLPTEPGVLLDLSTNQSGAQFAVPPGSYRVVTGSREDDEVGLEWCALVPESVAAAP